MGLTLREEIERELVRYDKQKLITECLKLFDSNKQLSFELQNSREVNTATMSSLSNAKVEIARLKARTTWQVINDRLSQRIERIRKRNAKYRQ